MVRSAVWVPNRPVPLVRVAAEEVVGNPGLRDAWRDDVAGAFVPELLWRLAGRPTASPMAGLRDDNRSALLPEHRHTIRGREYVVAVKGCGAEYDAFAHARITAKTLRGICRDPALVPLLAAEDGAPTGFITGERWFGNAPYGGQAPDNAMLGLLASLRADLDNIAGFRICPVVALVRLPDPFARVASKFFWYRRYDGAYWQEVRLMPSNVRLYFHSPLTFGVDTARTFTLFGIESSEAAESFLANLARSAIAALTLFARTLRYDDRAGRYLGLAYHDVWLDKDAVIAPDGVLQFADLEGIEDAPAADPDAVQEAVREQFYRNLYEANYALEAMAGEAMRRWGIPGGAAERRRWIADVLERACRPDPYVRVEREGERTVLSVEPARDADACAVALEWSSGVV